jgi:pimeloyl-ACP methyl ester carboxylesterase
VSGDGDLPLAAQDQSIPPWPGELVALPSGPSVFVRHTARVGPGPDLGRIVHVHGLGGSSTNWTDLAALLAPYAQSDAVDLPGFGRSPAPMRGDWSQDHQIRVLVEYLELTGAATQPVHLTANSMGGAAGIAVAADRPDLVRTLTLISPAVPDLRLVAHLRRSPMPVLLLPGLGSLAERKLAALPPHRRVIATVQMCVADPTRIAHSRLDEAVQELIERAQLPHARHSGRRALRGLARSYLRPKSRSLWAQASRIQAPTLVVWGAADRLVDVARAPRLAAAIPDARLVVLDGVGHVAMIESPEAVARPLLGLMSGTATAEAS